MILAAGKGTRMRASAEDPPKPLTQIGNQSLLFRMLGRLEAAGLEAIVVNVHHKAQAIEAALESYSGKATITISDERDALLETGGGVKRALPHLAPTPETAGFLVANGDVLWREETPVLDGFLAQFDPQKMDALLLLAARNQATGYDGTGDYTMSADGQLRRKTEREADYIFAGVQILSPSLFATLPEGAFSLNQTYDLAQNNGRLYGHVLDGLWMHVGTPEGRAEAEAAL
tara:strand:- start:702 stop:1394 length:693 start_codon:yes stop_codon:yes gene_type:complete